MYHQREIRFCKLNQTTIDPKSCFFCDFTISQVFKCYHQPRPLLWIIEQVVFFGYGYEFSMNRYRGGHPPPPLLGRAADGHGGGWKTNIHSKRRPPLLIVQIRGIHWLWALVVLFPALSTSAGSVNATVVEAPAESVTLAKSTNARFGKG